MISEVDQNLFVTADIQQVTGDLPDGDVVILSLKNGVYYGLNEVGGRIWKLIQQPTSVNRILEILLDEYDVEPDQCKREVNIFIQDLVNIGLIRLNQEPILDL